MCACCTGAAEEGEHALPSNCTPCTYGIIYDFVLLLRSVVALELVDVRWQWPGTHAGMLCGTASANHDAQLLHGSWTNSLDVSKLPACLCATK